MISVRITIGTGVLVVSPLRRLLTRPVGRPFLRVNCPWARNGTFSLSCETSAKVALLTRSTTSSLVCAVRTPYESISPAETSDRKESGRRRSRDATGALQTGSACYSWFQSHCMKSSVGDRSNPASDLHHGVHTRGFRPKYFGGKLDGRGG